jgi:hypothetical protein
VVSDKGASSRRTRIDDPVGWSGAPPTHNVNARFWPTLAIVATIVATAGWTTVVVMSLDRSQGGGAAAASPTDIPDTSSPAPFVASHDFPQLEALLPTSVAGTTLSIESWTGDAIFADDPWSQAMTTFLSNTDKTPADLEVAQAYDPNNTINVSAAAYRVVGMLPDDLRDGMIGAWKSQYPDLVTSQVTVGGKTVTKGVFGNGLPDSYWYESGAVVFDVETTDDTLASGVLSQLPPPTGPASSPGASPSKAPTASPSPS